MGQMDEGGVCCASTTQIEVLIFDFRWPLKRGAPVGALLVEETKRRPVQHALLIFGYTLYRFHDIFPSKTHNGEGGEEGGEEG